MNQLLPHARLLARYRKAQAEAAHKADLARAVSGKGPRALAAAHETAAKAARRCDALAKQLSKLGVQLS